MLSCLHGYITTSCIPSGIDACQMLQVCSRLDRLEARIASDAPAASNRGLAAPLACMPPAPAQEACSLDPFSFATATQASNPFGPFSFESRHLPFDGGGGPVAACSPFSSAPAVPSASPAPAGDLFDLLGLHDPQQALAPVPHCTEANRTSAPANGLMDNWQVGRRWLSQTFEGRAVQELVVVHEQRIWPNCSSSHKIFGGPGFSFSMLQVAGPDLAQLGAAGAGTTPRTAGPDAALSDLDELRALPTVPQVVLQPQPPPPVETPGAAVRPLPNTGCKLI